MNLLANAPSADLKNGGSPITIAGLSNNKIETSVINNKCVIVSKDLSIPVLLSYDKSSGNVSQSTITLEIRCLLYTSDAADEQRGVDLGGRRIIKKKKKKKKQKEKKKKKKTIQIQNEIVTTTYVRIRMISMND